MKRIELVAILFQVVGDDEALSTNELIDEVCKSLGKQAHIWRLPKSLMTGIATVSGWLHLPLNPDRLQYKVS